MGIHDVVVCLAAAGCRAYGAIAISMAFVTDPIGIIGEAEATKMLEKKGLRVLEHNWRMGHLEVDLIAEGKNEIVFVEVKARTTTFGDRLPEEYVDENKKKRMVAAANAYVKYHRIDKQPRFDIIGLLVDAASETITYRCHMENAFVPKQKTVGVNSYNGAWKWQHRKRSIRRN